MYAQVLTVSLMLLLTGRPPQQPPPRDSAGPARSEAQLERTLRAAIASGQAPETSYVRLEELLRGRGETERADDVALAAKDAYPKSVRAQTAAAGVYNRRGDFDATIAALRAVAALQPQSAEAQHRLAVFFWDKSRADERASAEIKLSYIMQGLDAENQALLLNPDYLEALTYKNILLRLQANLSADPAEQRRLIAEADELRNRVIAMQREKNRSNAPAAAAEAESPFAGFSEPFDQAMARLQPVRVGGTVRVPTKVKDVKPRYPPEAQNARVQGVVIIEALVDETGQVANARVLRSIPLLDAAALQAVSQWAFTPTEVDGRTIPLVMTVTVNFTLQN